MPVDCGSIERLASSHRVIPFWQADVTIYGTANWPKSSSTSVNNVTDEPLRIFRDNQANRIDRYDEYGRRYLFDVTLKF